MAFRSDLSAVEDWYYTSSLNGSGVEKHLNMMLPLKDQSEEVVFHPFLGAGMHGERPGRCVAHNGALAA